MVLQSDSMFTFGMNLHWRRWMVEKYIVLIDKAHLYKWLVKYLIGYHPYVYKEAIRVSPT